MRIAHLAHDRRGSWSSTFRQTASALVLIGCFLGLAVGIGLLVPRLPSLTYGVLAVLAASVVALSVALARTGRTLDPAFVVVTATLLAVPWGLLNLYGVIAMTYAIVGLAPFVLVAWLVRPQARRQTILLAPLLLLALLASISLAWSPDPAYGQLKIVLWLFTGLMPAAFILILAASSMRVAWTLILAISIVSSVYFLLAAAPDDDYARATVFGWNPIWSSRVASVGALVALFGPFPKWVRVLALPVFLMHGWAAGSLGPLLGLALGIGAGMLEKLRIAETSSRRASLGLLGIWLVAGCALLVFLTGLIEPALAPVAGDPNVTSRADFLAASLQLFMASPVVGIGLGGFTTAGLGQYPHNLPVEIGLELGILGLLALLAWWLLALRGAAGSPLLVALLVATSVFSLFSGNLPFNEVFWVFSALAVAMVPLDRLERADLALQGPGRRSRPFRLPARTRVPPEASRSR